MRHLSVIVARLSTVIGEITLSNEHGQQPQFSTFLQGNSEHKPQTLAAVFSNMNEGLGKELQKGSGKANELVQRALLSDKKTAIAARIGIFATTIALVLICIFAIESILRMCRNAIRL